MIVKYKQFTITGAYGYSISVNKNEEDTIEELGKIEEWTYLYVPEDFEIKSLDERLEAQVVEELSQEEREILYGQDFIESKKRQVRLNIEKEVGDIYDLVADCMKLIELNMVLTSRLAGDYLGTHTFDTTQKEEYKARVGNFLNGLDSGALMIRGYYENPNDIMQKLMNSTDKINRLVKEKYFDDVRKAQLI